MNIDNLSYLKVRFQKKAPSVNDAAMWFTNIMDSVPKEEHPWVWDAIYDIHPDLLLGGLLYPYQSEQFEEYLDFFDHKYGLSFVEKFTKGAAVSSNTAYALALLKSNKHTTFEQLYGDKDIWTYISGHLPHNLAMDILIDNVDKPQYVKALLPKVTNYYFIPGNEITEDKYETSMILHILNIIEEQYPSIEGHREWKNVKHFFDVRMIYQERLDAQEEGSFQTLQSCFLDAMVTMIKAWDTLQIPVHELDVSQESQKLQTPSPYTDDGLFIC